MMSLKKPFDMLLEVLNNTTTKSSFLITKCFDMLSTQILLKKNDCI